MTDHTLTIHEAVAIMLLGVIPALIVAAYCPPNGCDQKLKEALNWVVRSRGNLFTIMKG